jgi:hypothetical protein
MRRRGWLTWLAIGFAAIAVLADGAERREPSGPRDRAERRRWAMSRMDEMANEGLRCRARFAARRQVEACQAEFTRRFREYNEIYLEATRE